MSKVCTKKVEWFKNDFVLIIREFEVKGNAPYVASIHFSKKPLEMPLCAVL
jgi:hypothetical protein